MGQPYGTALSQTLQLWDSVPFNFKLFKFMGQAHGTSTQQHKQTPAKVFSPPPPPEVLSEIASARYCRPPIFVNLRENGHIPPKNALFWPISSSPMGQSLWDRIFNGTAVFNLFTGLQISSSPVP
jgi:hypothetical protein